MADRHSGKQIPISARIDRPDFDTLEAARKEAGLSRRQAIIAAIRQWVSQQVKAIN